MIFGPGVCPAFTIWSNGRARIRQVVQENFSFLISAAESALAGIAALVPVGSAPELSHKRTEPQLSCRACGTYPQGRNAPDNNLPIRHAPAPRRYAPDRPLDHRAWQWPRHD